MSESSKPDVRVLVIDDSVTIRAMMARVLEGDRSIKVSTVRSADEADEILGRERFDVVTLDVEMPGRNGLDYLQDLVTRYQVPVVMLSASTGEGVAGRAQSLRDGAAACFDKADAVRLAPALIRLVRDVAGGKIRAPVHD